LNAVDSLLKDSIDMHAHYGPDAFARRKIDALQGAQLAHAAGMRAIVLKNHQYCTAPLASTVNQVVPGLSVFGSISLNTQAGGLNPDIVETAVRSGAKVIWMPTQSSNYDFMRNTLRTGGISILDETGELKPEVEAILDIAKQHEIAVATGHLPVNEAFKLVESARKKGLTKIIATHPLRHETDIYFTLEQQCRIADMGAIVEYCFVAAIENRLDPKSIAQAIRAVGVERCILSTDLGQAYNPAPVDGMKIMITAMLDNGFTGKELELMIKTNPARLLGLD